MCVHQLIAMKIIERGKNVPTTNVELINFHCRPVRSRKNRNIPAFVRTAATTAISRPRRRNEIVFDVNNSAADTSTFLFAVLGGDQLELSGNSRRSQTRKFTGDSI